MQQESSKAYRNSESNIATMREIVKSDAERCYSLTRDNAGSERSLSEQHDMREEELLAKAVSPPKRASDDSAQRKAEENTMVMTLPTEAASAVKGSQCVSASQLLMERIEALGLVPLVFFAPNLSSKDKQLLLSHGGMMAHTVECFTVQLFKADLGQGDWSQEALSTLADKERDCLSQGKGESQKLADYQPGVIVSYRWVVDMVQSQRRLPRAPYELVRLEYPYSSPKKRGLSSNT